MNGIASKKIGILAGGPSSEREISLKSGEAVYNSLRAEKYDVVLIDIKDDNKENLKTSLKEKGIEIAFIALHGRFGEDGEIQEILDELHIPYTGSGPQASRLALDKVATKKIFAKSGIVTPPYMVFQRKEKIEAENLEFPLVVKPRCEGSSIGLSIVRGEDELKKAIDKACMYDDIIIIEKYIKGREITVGIFDEEPLCAIEIVPGSDFYDYEAKYIRSDTKYLVPAPIDEEEHKKTKYIGKKAHIALNCRGFSRVDMILGEDGEIYALEVNTIPGLTSRSLLPKAAEQAGISFSDLCKRMVELALKK